MATAVRVDAAFEPPTTAEELLLLPDGMHGEIVDGGDLLPGFAVRLPKPFPPIAAEPEGEGAAGAAR